MMRNTVLWLNLTLAIIAPVVCSADEATPVLSEAESANRDQLALNSGKEVIVRYTTVKNIGLSPNSKAWDSTPATEVNLTSQKITVPKGGGSVQTVTVKALHNGRQVAFKLSWKDGTRDMENGVDTFRDAVALAFPVKNSEYPPSPFMGDEINPINIWQWGSDWQAAKDGSRDLSARQPRTNGVWQYPQDKQILHKRYPGMVVASSPIIEYVAAGFGSLTKQVEQNVEGKGVYQNGGWSVVFVRKLEQEEKGDALFIPGEKTMINFAVWNGSNKEVSSKKSISLYWLPLLLEGANREQI
ncbi:MAG: hypothetical protein IIA77_00915 [Proteobacteria bacterium]|nr:hypothetical protein [Pseudomonadota bacterium]